MSLENGATKRMWLKRWNSLGEVIISSMENKYVNGLLRIALSPLTLIIYCLVVLRTAFFYDSQRDYMDQVDAAMGTIVIFLFTCLIGLIGGIGIIVYLDAHRSSPASIEYIEEARSIGECERDFVKKTVDEIIVKRTVKNIDIDDAVEACEKHRKYLKQLEEIKKDVK